jgi:NAD-specific glutamate dehydrogenase
VADQRAALLRRLPRLHEALVEAVLAGTEGDDVSERVDAWLTGHQASVERFRQVTDDVETTGVFDLATLAVARRALRELADSR